MTCIYCGGVEPLVEGKKYCVACIAGIYKECIRCKRPFDDVKHFQLDYDRCNACQNKYLKEKERAQNAKAQNAKTKPFVEESDEYSDTSIIIQSDQDVSEDENENSKKLNRNYKRTAQDESEDENVNNKKPRQYIIRRKEKPSGEGKISQPSKKKNSTSRAKRDNDKLKNTKSIQKNLPPPPTVVDQELETLYSLTPVLVVRGKGRARGRGRGKGNGHQQMVLSDYF